MKYLTTICLLLVAAGCPEYTTSPIGTWDAAAIRGSEAFIGTLHFFPDGTVTEDVLSTPATTHQWTIGGPRVNVGSDATSIQDGNTYVTTTRIYLNMESAYYMSGTYFVTRLQDGELEWTVNGTITAMKQ